MFIPNIFRQHLSAVACNKLEEVAERMNDVDVSVCACLCQCVHVNVCMFRFSSFNCFPPPSLPASCR
eukprot:m.112717 g.112717  ORF g.112717 m.112717 type:complete len:67 (+) comp12789_c1_seq12:378-578(+)